MVLNYTDFYLWVSVKGKALLEQVVMILPMSGLTFLIPIETASLWNCNVLFQI